MLHAGEGFVDENAHKAHGIGQPSHLYERLLKYAKYRPGLSRGATSDENKAQQVGSSIECNRGVVQIRNAADLDAALAGQDPVSKWGNSCAMSVR